MNSTSRTVQLGDHTVGMGYPPFVIAEMSANHNGSLERALEIVAQAAASGVHALKIQTYTADSITIDCSEEPFQINDENSLWNGRTLYGLYQEAATPYEWHEPIMDRCKELGMLCFSSAFDPKAVDFLEDLGVPLYKVASFENNDLPLIEKIASTGKPIIISSGMASIAQLSEAIDTIRGTGNDQIVLLKCTSTYPADPSSSHLRTIPHLEKLFSCVVGLSDHTLGIGVPLAAVALGASVIEKHFTLSRSDGGPDGAFSLEPTEMKALVEESARAQKALGTVFYGRTEKEEKSAAHRRSLYVIKDIRAGETVTEEHVRSIRPAGGLPPKYLQHVLGRKATSDLKRGTALAWSHIG